MKIQLEKLNYDLEFHLRLDNEEPDVEKAKALLTKRLREIINDPDFDPLEYGDCYD